MENINYLMGTMIMQILNDLLGDTTHHWLAEGQDKLVCKIFPQHKKCDASSFLKILLEQYFTPFDF